MFKYLFKNQYHPVVKNSIHQATIILYCATVMSPIILSTVPS